MELDIVITRDSGHEDFFGLRIDGDDDVDIAKATIEHLARAGIDTREINDRAFFGEIGLTIVIFLFDFYFELADDFETVFVFTVILIIESSLVGTGVDDRDISGIIESFIEHRCNTRLIGYVGTSLLFGRLF